MSYSWKPAEIFPLLGISVPNRTEAYVPCPACKGKRFSFNMSKGIGKCWQCEFSADSAGYYAAFSGLSLAEARKDIETRLGITRDGSRTLPPRIVYNETPKEVDKADDATLNDTYRAFLSELVLADKNKTDLFSRGLMDEQVIEALNYKTFPRMDEIDYFNLCKRLQRDGHSLKGVPGFFRAKNGEGDYTFIQITKGVIMPQVNHQNQITALQIRKDDDLLTYDTEKGEWEGKCSWFSSKNRNGGCSCNANVHYACDWRLDEQTRTYKPVFEDGFMLTEGIMKADIAHFLQPNIPVIAVPGVHALESLKTELERLRDWGVKTILLSYDMDYETNPNVQKALKKTEDLITSTGLRVKHLRWETDLSLNGQKVYLKGIDDYLAYAKLGVVPQVKNMEQ